MRWTASLLCFAMGSAVIAQPQTLPDRRYGSWGVDLAARDLTVRPGDDFNAYAGGSWANRTPIPADSPFAGPLEDLSRLTEARLAAIIAGSEPTSQIGALYRSFMDVTEIERRGVAPLQADLARIATAADRDALAVAVSHPGFLSPPVAFGIDTDPDDARQMAFNISQAGLTLPDRDFYLLDRFNRQRQALHAYAQRVFALLGSSDAEAKANEVVAFETAVARVSYSHADSGDSTKSINPTNVAAFAREAPGLPWRDMLSAEGLPNAPDQRLVIGEKDAIRAIAALWATTPLDALKAWAVLHAVVASGRYLPKPFGDNRDAYVGAVYGIKAPPTRERQAIWLVDDQLGELTGHEYVRRYFDERRKAAMLELADNVKAAVRRRLEANDWLSAMSKQIALQKLDRVSVQVGYPDVWRDYRRLRLAPDDLFGNVERSKMFEWSYRLSLLGKPTDRRLWAMTPQTLNAYNGGQTLKIVFPAARLQPPFFRIDSDPAVNYGGIGAIIGHELTHSFDEDGRRIDASGNFRNWWTAQDEHRFNERIAVLGAQYDAFEALPGAHVNGRQTMPENIADLGGLLAALDAYHASLGGKAAPVIDGLTGDQRFFLSYAQVRREKVTDEMLRDQISADEHAPGRFRVNGPVRNIDAWYSAFAVTPQDKNYVSPTARARVW